MRLGAQDRRLGSWLRQNGPQTVLVLLSLGLAGFVLVFARLFPAPGLLPALSLVTIVVSLGIAGAAWALSARRDTEAVNYWDVAGGLMLIGVFAASLADGNVIVAPG